MIELYLLFGFIIIGAVIAVENKGLLSSVVALGAVGLALCVAFFMLRATDVAITQIIVEILVLAILIKTTGIKRDKVELISGGRDVLSIAVAAMFIIVFGIIFFIATQALPPFGDPLLTISEKYIARSASHASAINVVSTVMLEYRAYDVLGIIVVLFSSTVGAILIVKGVRKVK